MSDSASRLTVLSVVGAGRSGTTVLANILGEVDGFASAGELRWLWKRGILAGRPCGCGRTPQDCPVWSPVITAALAAVGGDPRGTVDHIIDSQQELARRRNLPRVLRSVDGSQGEWEAMRIVRTATAAACATFSEVTGSRVVVDTSKRAVDAAVIAGLDGVDHYVLHLVRDPRAVVHSWHRVKTFTVGGQTRTMGRLHLLSTVRRWISSCIAAEALRRRIPRQRWMDVRYEDFATDPRACIESVLSFMGEGGGTPFVDDHTVALRPNHVVAGNPNRFTTGEVTVSADNEWQDQLSRNSQRLVAAMTMPLMLRYGYAGRSGRRPR